MAFPDPPGDQLGVLGTEVEDQDFFAMDVHFFSEKMKVSGLRKQASGSSFIQKFLFGLYKMKVSGLRKQASGRSFIHKFLFGLYQG
jgi:hypothetical protein